MFLVKNSYYRLALIYHPDKATTIDKLEAAAKFNIIHQAYSVLSNAELKTKYDLEGSRVLFARPSPTADWENYLKTISEYDVTIASNSYKGSTEERDAVLKEFISSNSSLTHVLNNVPFIRREDEMRLVEMLKEAMEHQEIPRIKIKKMSK